MTRDEELVIRPAATAGYLIFATTIAVNPVLWPLGALIAARQAEDALIKARADTP